MQIIRGSNTPNGRRNARRLSRPLQLVSGFIFLAGLLALAVSLPGTTVANSHRAMPQPINGDVGAPVVGSDLPAALQVRHVRLRDGRLIVVGWLDRAAAGDGVVVVFRARGEQIRIPATVGDDGRFVANRRLEGEQSGARIGLVAVHYAGNDSLRASADRLLAARVPSRLQIERVRMQHDELVVLGRVTPRVRTPVRILVEYNRVNGSPEQVRDRARVNRGGRFLARVEVPRAVSTLGGRLSVTQPGGLWWWHGQRLGRDVGGT